MIPEPRLDAGDSLAGRYVLRGPVGRGPLGLCWLADDMSAGGEVVLKIVDGSLLPVEGARNRFVREALRFRAVQSQYLGRVVEAFVAGVRAEGSSRPVDHAVLVHERLPGFTLRRLIERRQQRGMGPFPAVDLLLIVGQLATGLHAVHRAGLVHGNIKPENVFLTSGGVRLGDLAMAPALGVSGFVRAQAQSYGGRFLAPEICRGSPFDTATDLYALGALLAELVGGDGKGRANRGLSPALRAMLARATSDVPTARYPDAHALAAAFVAGGQGADAEESPPPVTMHEEESTIADRPPRSKARERVITAMGRAVSALTDEDIEELEPTRVYRPPPRASRPDDIASAVAGLLGVEDEQRTGDSPALSDGRAMPDATLRVALQPDGTVVPPSPPPAPGAPAGRSTLPMKPLESPSPPARSTLPMKPLEPPAPPVVRTSEPPPPPAPRRGGKQAAVVVPTARPARRGQQRTIIGAPATMSRRTPPRLPVAPNATSGEMVTVGRPRSPAQGVPMVRPAPPVELPRLRPVELPDLRRSVPPPSASEVTPALDDSERAPSESAVMRRRGRLMFTPTTLAWALMGMAAAAALTLGVMRNVVENHAAERLAAERLEKARRVEELRRQQQAAVAAVTLPVPVDGAPAVAADGAPPSAVEQAMAPGGAGAGAGSAGAPAAASRCPEDSVPIEAGGRAACIAAYEYPGPGKRPRTGVSLGEAQALCATSGARLCRNDEWERACSGAEGRRYPYGDDLRPRLCHLGESSGRVDVAGRFGACRTPDGIHDLLGNAAEWVEEGVLRGGDARVPPAKADCGLGRTPPSVYLRDAAVGFRCCWDLPEG